MAQSTKVHYLSSFALPDIYKKHGLIWKIACRIKVRVDEDDIEWSASPEEVTCANCRKYFDGE